MRACECAGPRPSHSAWCGSRTSDSVQCTRNETPRICRTWSIVDPLLICLSETLRTERWIVTQSFSRLGSITVSQTRCGGASISVLTWTVLIGGRGTLTIRSPRGQRLGLLPLAQGVLDRRVE